MAFSVGNERSLAQPSVALYDIDDSGEDSFCMAFKSLDSSNRLLFTTSADGVQDSWNPSRGTGQTTQAAPALVVAGNSLVVVFISDDPTNRILYAIYDKRHGNFPNVKDTGETGTAVTAVAVGGTVLIYFVSNDSTDRLLGKVLNIGASQRSDDLS